jgi:lipid-A-disaccharide synthase
MLGIMLQSVQDFPGSQFVIAGVSSIPSELYLKCMKEAGVPIVYGQTYNLLKYAEAALVTSGTATLETALLGVPQVVCYKGGYLSYVIARMIVHVRFISLVNLIMGKQVIRELIQGDFDKDHLTRELNRILYDSQVREKILTDYSLLKEKLGGKGASAKAAGLIVQYLKKITV